jgi:hypothetical protein
MSVAQNVAFGLRQERLAGAEIRARVAAMLDLGARPWKVLLVITLPLIAPSLVTGWLLAYPLARRSGDRQLRFRAGFDDPAYGDLLQRPPRYQPADQRSGDDFRRGRFGCGSDRCLAYVAARQGAGKDGLNGKSRLSSSCHRQVDPRCLSLRRKQQEWAV